MGKGITGLLCFALGCLSPLSQVKAVNANARTLMQAGTERTRGAAPPARMTGSCLAIPDDAYNGTPESMVCVTQPGPNQTLQSVQLKLGVQHSFAGDLTVKVISPWNRAVTVLNRPGFAESADDGSGCCGDSSGLSAASPLFFDDAATLSAEDMGANLSDAKVVCRDDGQCAFAPVAGVAAAGTFADFASANGAGTWQICVGDSENLETGSLCSATLVFNDQEGDLALTASYPNGVNSSGPFALRMRVTNNGPSAQSGVIVAAALPAGTTYLGDDCGAHNNGSWIWSVGGLANAASATCTVQLQLQQTDMCPQLVTTAMVSGELPDANTSNDAAIAQNGGNNLIADPSLEMSGLAGGGAWTSTSTNFGKVFCAQGRCTENPTVGGYDGEWWAWFGGVDPSAPGGATLPEIGTLQQVLTIPAGANTLTFQVRFPWCGGVATDFLALRIDGSEVWRADATDAGLCGNGYAKQSVDVAAFANGASHTLEFRGEQAGQGSLSSFFVDKVGLVAPVACVSNGDAIFVNGFEN